MPEPEYPAVVRDGEKGTGVGLTRVRTYVFRSGCTAPPPPFAVEPEMVGSFSFEREPSSSDEDTEVEKCFEGRDGVPVVVVVVAVVGVAVDGIEFARNLDWE